MEYGNQTPKVRDAKELLSEAKRLFRDFFHRGYMTLQTAGDRWKQYHQAVATAKDALWQPLFPAEQTPALTPESTPMVTVIRSELEQLPVGTRIPLAEANERIQATDTAGKLAVQIDFYTTNGPDRYRTELDAGTGAESIQKQIAQRIAVARQADMGSFFEAVSTPSRDNLQAHVSPSLSQSFEDISTRLVASLTEHCAISNLEQHLENQANLMPQATQWEFRETAQALIGRFRAMANSNTLTPPAMERTGPGKETAATLRQGNPKSVKITLRAMQGQGGAEKPKPPRPKER